MSGLRFSQWFYRRFDFPGVWCCVFGCRSQGCEGSYCLHFQSKKFLILDFLTQKMTAPWSFKMLGITLLTNQHHILKKFNFHYFDSCNIFVYKCRISLLRLVYNVRSAWQGMLLCLPICSILATLIIVTNKASVTPYYVNEMWEIYQHPLLLEYNEMSSFYHKLYKCEWHDVLKLTLPSCGG